MKITKPTKNSAPKAAALADEDLDKVTGGGTSHTSKGGDTPQESLSLNFTKVEYTYKGQ